jgi:beta-lactamase class A
MLGLGKKKKKEEEEEIEDEELDDESDFDESDSRSLKLKNRKKIKDEDFKDLGAQNKRKRREPVKQWGRTERLWVFGLLFVTAGVSAILAISSRSWKLPNAPRLQAPEVSIPFANEETIVLDARKADKERADRITQKFDEMTGDLTGVYGMYVVNLANGYSFGVNHTESFQAASLIKLPVMAAMYIKDEKNIIDLDDKYVLKASDKTAGSGSLYGRPVGYEITYRNMINLMGKQSDNTAFTIAVNTLGTDELALAITKFGMKKTFYETNKTTPEDIGIFFDGLYNDNILQRKNRDEMLSSMTDTIYEAWLPAQLPETVKTSHKFGREVHVINDAGIVYADTPYVIVLMSKGIVDREGDEIIPQISKMVYEEMLKK